jgi:hypothetical protein
VKELLQSPKNAFSMTEEGTGGDGEHNNMFLGEALDDAWERRSKPYWPNFLLSLLFGRTD